MSELNLEFDGTKVETDSGSENILELDSNPKSGNVKTSLEFGNEDLATNVLKNEADNYEVEDDFKIEKLPPEEQKIVSDFVEKINLDDTASVVVYGQKSQKNISNMSSNMLKEVRTRNSGIVGDNITKLVKELKGMGEVEEEKSFLGFLKPKAIKNKTDVYKIQYKSIDANINTVVTEMDGHKVKLIRDIHNLDNLYETNKEQYKELTLYIIAGEERLRRFYDNEVATKRNQATQTGDQIHAQELQDLLNQAQRFEKRLHDLKLTRVVCIQFAPQIRLIQNNDSELLEKIQNTISNAIPIWRSNMVISMGLENSRRALEAQKAITDMTNDLLKQNSEMLKNSTIEIAKEAERGIIDLDTIQTINSNLIATLDEVVNIQRGGISQRQNTEREIVKIESDLKNNILKSAEERIAIAKNANL
ncbi:MAG: toxic anion resistance protein [Lachnospirales bacterium]